MNLLEDVERKNAENMDNEAGEKKHLSPLLLSNKLSVLLCVQLAPCEARKLCIAETKTESCSPTVYSSVTCHRYCCRHC